jgi:hypothetical protein
MIDMVDADGNSVLDFAEFLDLLRLCFTQNCESLGWFFRYVGLQRVYALADSIFLPHSPCTCGVILACLQ